MKATEALKIIDNAHIAINSLSDALVKGIEFDNNVDYRYIQGKLTQLKNIVSHVEMQCKHCKK